MGTKDAKPPAAFIDWRKLDTFTTQYIETALWAGSYYPDEDSADSGNPTPLDDIAGIHHITQETLAVIVEDCAAFQSEAGEMIVGVRSQAGHDFFLTRNRHGAGFWDGDWPAEDGEKLTQMAHNYGTFELDVLSIDENEWPTVGHHN